MQDLDNNFSISQTSVFSENQKGPGVSPPPPTHQFRFRLLSGQDFELLNGSNFLLLKK